MGVRTGDYIDIYRAVYTDDCISNYRAVIKTIIRLPSILVQRISRALELRIGL